ncbi:Altered inheritance of mitochondria protein 34 mitochondrial [Bienertia sinuspersici]
MFNASAVEINDRFSVKCGSGGVCYGIYCLNSAAKSFNVKYEMEMAQIEGVHIIDFTSKALKEELQARHMTISGNRSDLVCRLQLAIIAQKLAAYYPESPDDIHLHNDDESISGTIIISDSEDANYGRMCYF